MVSKTVRIILSMVVNRDDAVLFLRCLFCSFIDTSLVYAVSNGGIAWLYVSDGTDDSSMLADLAGVICHPDLQILEPSRTEQHQEPLDLSFRTHTDQIYEQAFIESVPKALGALQGDTFVAPSDFQWGVRYVESKH